MVPLGVIGRLLLCLAALVPVIKRGEVVSPYGGLCHDLLGCRVTFLGSVIGFAYWCGPGFCVGLVVFKLCNWLVQRNTVAPDTK